MKTKYGNAKINNNGYYVITSSKEDNHGKYLHRLIWEDFYRCEVPKGYVIHHKNFNKLDNCILNLQLMKHSEHNSIHHKSMSFELSDESRRKISEAKNTAGYLNVCKAKCKKCKQNFIWTYRYYKDGKRIKISSVSLSKLEEKVKAKGLIWRKFE